MQAELYAVEATQRLVEHHGVPDLRGHGAVDAFVGATLSHVLAVGVAQQYADVRTGLGLATEDPLHPGVLGVPARTTVRDLADTLARYRLHAACVSGVTEDRGGERLVWAIASDMDVLRAAHGGQLDAAAGEIAATEALTVDADEPLDEAAARMVAHGVGHAIVAAGAGAPPAGVLSSLDVLGVLAGDQG